mmetsp:Transcript_15145/g.33409  ORF Transcript_15145/g.33409 Transcript_15145/m.33409 type:complete len:277 (+) Transcript_15145:143-973(+)
MGSLLRLLRALALPPFPTCLLCLLALGLQSLNSGLLLLDAVLHAPIQTSCFLTHHQARKGRVLLRLRYGLDLRRMYDPLRSPPARSTRLLIHLLLLCLLLLGLRLGLLLLLARLRGLLGLALVRPRGPRSLRRLLVLLLFLLLHHLNRLLLRCGQTLANILQFLDLLSVPGHISLLLVVHEGRQMGGQLGTRAVRVRRQRHARIDAVEDPLRLYVLTLQAHALLRPVNHVVRYTRVRRAVGGLGPVPSHLGAEGHSAQLHPLQRHLAVEEEHVTAK